MGQNQMAKKSKHQHKWKPIAVSQTRPPFAASMTNVLFRCRCKEVKALAFVGNWTLAEIKGMKKKARKREEPTDPAHGGSPRLVQ
jgi:hypothetical protein